MKRNGYIYIQEPDDSGKICYPHEEVLKTIIDSFASLPWIEDRFFAKKIPSLLINAGFKNIDCLYKTIDNLDKSNSEKKQIYDVTFSHRKSDYDCVDEQARSRNLIIMQKLDDALDQMYELIYSKDFYYAETRYIFLAQKLE